MVLESSFCGAWLRRNAVTSVSLCAATTAIMLLLAPVPASANCYELIGCTNSDYFKPWQLKKLSCQILYDVRNTIYKENGYCFHTKKAIKYFGNAGCKIHDAAAVPLNGAERHNVSAIKKVEQKKGCL